MKGAHSIQAILGVYDALPDAGRYLPPVAAPQSHGRTPIVPMGRCYANLADELLQTLE